MIKIEKTETYGWESAVRGMRNPLGSHHRSDSAFDGANVVIGANDLLLMKQLSKAGNDHAKYLRMINVTADITAPLYWWKEYDTYKVSTVANSTSTMHTIHKRDLTMDDFSHEHLSPLMKDHLIRTIDAMNVYRQMFVESGAKGFWWQIIQTLPCSFNQKRTVQLNYQVLKNMYHSRKAHKLDEWREFCKWVEALPYFKGICIDAVSKKEDNA